MSDLHVINRRAKTENTLEHSAPIQRAASLSINPLNSITFMISMKDSIEDLKKILNVCSDAKVGLSHIETRKKRLDKENFEDAKNGLEVLAQTKIPANQLENFTESLRQISPDVFIQNDSEDLQNETQTVSNETGLKVHRVPWFPRDINELDNISNNVLMYGKELDADHPGFKDAEYRKRRVLFAEIAYNYRHGQPIPTVEYTDTEKQTWASVYRELTKLYQNYACKEFLHNFSLLQEHAGYKESDLPQLNVVSEYLKKRTGFTLRPVAGYLSARDFLAGLAFRVFYCTQYIRHHKDPFYTPEPDCCHELLGHMPLLADATFARFSQEMGLASLGASDDEVKKLATCYFFTIEFGLCRQDGQLRVYGAGLLSSVAELKHALTDKAVVRPFKPEEVIKEECLVTTFQNNYFETPSFESATEQMRHFARTIKRPFDVQYNPYTQRIELINTPAQVAKTIDHLKEEMSNISCILEKMDSNCEILKTIRGRVEMMEPKSDRN